MITMYYYEVDNQVSVKWRLIKTRGMVIRTRRSLKQKENPTSSCKYCATMVLKVVPTNTEKTRKSTSAKDKRGTSFPVTMVSAGAAVKRIPFSCMKNIIENKRHHSLLEAHYMKNKAMISELNRGIIKVRKTTMQGSFKVLKIIF